MKLNFLWGQTFPWGWQLPWGSAVGPAVPPHPVPLTLPCPLPRAMRVAVVAALLLLLATARPGTARSRRDAPAEGSEPAPAEDFLSRHFQSFSDLLTRELPEKLRAQELRAQAEYGEEDRDPLTGTP